MPFIHAGGTGSSTLTLEKSFFTKSQCTYQCKKEWFTSSNVNFQY